MTVQELIEKLTTFPPSADVLFDDIEVGEYRDITVEFQDSRINHEAGEYEEAALVLIGVEP